MKKSLLNLMGIITILTLTFGAKTVAEKPQYADGNHHKNAIILLADGNHH
ncbi:hypothetical protein [Bacillus clarus]|uniref:Uncharacterized protein n=1 Tax=Bacillus clarus TaxID=2338372 RepID=A0A090YYF2_9BACI|nr:hypothetical protein [Bacillus clarus]KFN03098.1 hypothetical protein DJ93_4705 [Bacillus clarus]